MTFIKSSSFFGTEKIVQNVRKLILAKKLQKNAIKLEFTSCTVINFSTEIILSRKSLYRTFSEKNYMDKRYHSETTFNNIIIEYFLKNYIDLVMYMYVV